jgi:acetyl esterase/lipase
MVYHRPACPGQRDRRARQRRTARGGARRERLAFQLLIYPVMDLSREHDSYATFADGPLLTADQMRWFRAH